MKTKVSFGEFAYFTTVGVGLMEFYLRRAHLLEVVKLADRFRYFGVEEFVRGFSGLQCCF